MNKPIAIAVLTPLFLYGCAERGLTSLELADRIEYSNERLVKEVQEEMRKPPEERYEIAVCRELERTLVFSTVNKGTTYGYSKTVAGNYYYYYARIDEYTDEDYVKDIYMAYDKLITMCMKYQKDMQWDFPVDRPDNLPPKK